jgi:hypothetical protein
VVDAQIGCFNPQVHLLEKLDDLCQVGQALH